MRVAIVGGGINGVMSAWALRRRGHEVALFERGVLMGATSAASSKLLHGGLRYLEQGDVRQVYEGLHERRWLTQRGRSRLRRSSRQPRCAARAAHAKQTRQSS